MSNTPSLLGCPFCGGGETQIHVNKGTWNGRCHGEPVSVEVRHWCESEQGQPSRMISRAGRDEASAIAAWNRRTPQPVVREPLTREKVKAIMAEAGYDREAPQPRADFITGLRHGERAHGITQKGDS